MRDHRTAGAPERPGRMAGGASGASPRPAFGADRLARIAELETWHFWFAGRRSLVDQLWDRHLGQDVRDLLDIGCGTGAYAAAMATRGHRVVGLDLRPEGLAQAGRFADRARFVQGDAEELPLRDGCFDAVVMLDLLEHADDAALLAEVRRVLRPGGVLIATVPSAPALWSFRDEAAGHLRRYTRPGLARALGGAGFLVLELRYYQCLLFPLVALSRLAGRSTPATRDLEDRPGGVLNAALRHVSRVEVGLGRLVPPPYGSSLAAVCRRP